MKSTNRLLFIIPAILVLGLIVINTGYVQYSWKGVTYVLNNSNEYIFEPQEPEQVRFDIDYPWDSSRNKIVVAEYKGAQLQIKSITQEGRHLRVIIKALYKIKYSGGNIFKDLPSPDIADITVVDQKGNLYEVFYNGSGPYLKRGREYHYMIVINEGILPETQLTMTIGDVTPIVYRRK